MRRILQAPVHGIAFVLGLLLIAAMPGQTQPAAMPAHTQPVEVGQALARTDSLWESGDRRGSMALLDSLLARPETRVLPEERLQLLLRAASRWASLGQPKQGEAASLEAIALATELHDSTAVRTSLRWLSWAVGAQGRTAEARQVCEQLLHLAEAAGDRHHEGWALVGLGWSKLSAGNAAEAERDFARAAWIFEDLEESEGIAWSQNALGAALSRLGAYQQARDAYTQAVWTAQEVGFHIVEGMALNNLASLEYSLGDPGIALERFARAEELQRQAGSRREGIIPALNVAICQIDLGRYDEAEENLSRQLCECRENGYDDLQGDVLYMLSDLQRVRGQRHAAAATLRQALGLGASLNLRTRVECLTGLSDVLAEMDSSRAAFEVIEASLRAVQDCPLGQIGPKLTLARADRLLALERPEEALATLDEVLAPQGVAPSDALLIQAMVLAAQAQRASGRKGSALATLYEAADLWERQRGTPLDPEWREQRGRTGERLYSSIAALLLEDSGQAPAGDVIREVFDRLQRFKARTLQERMQGPVGAVSRVAPPDVATLDELQAQLQPGELFLDFYSGREATVLIAATSRDRRLVRLPAAEELSGMVRDLLDLISTPPSPAGVDQEALRDVAQGLYACLFGQIEDLVGESRRIIVAPDGISTMAPYQYMFSARMAAKGDFEQTEKEWVRIPSATVWLSLKQRSPEKPGRLRILAVAGRRSGAGEALRGTVAEVRGLWRRYQGVKARTLGREAALTAADLEGYDVLHLASHLELDDQHPWQSRFQFAPEEPGALLRASAIAEQRIPAALVVLAACSSAGGRILSGEGVLGVSSAFLSAGAASVIATLWPVDDQVTAALVERFYAELAQGADVGGALSRAQQAVAGEPATSHPFYWAGFILIGDPRTQVPLQPRNLLLLAFGAGIVLAAGAVVVPRLIRGWPRGRPPHGPEAARAAGGPGSRRGGGVG